MATYDNDDPLMVYKATSDSDTMYHHEAMRERDAEYFREAMTKSGKINLITAISQ